MSHRSIAVVLFAFASVFPARAQEDKNSCGSVGVFEPGGDGGVYKIEEFRFHDLESRIKENGGLDPSEIDKALLWGLDFNDDGGSLPTNISMDTADAVLDRSAAGPLDPERALIRNRAEKLLREYLENGNRFMPKPYTPGEEIQIPTDPIPTPPRIIQAWKDSHPGEVAPAIIQLISEYPLSAGAIDCSPFAGFFLDMFEERNKWYASIDGYDEDELPEVLRQAEGYHRSCLSSVTSVPIDRQQLFRHAGILVLDDERIWCSATRVFRDVIVTARHCIQKLDTLLLDRLHFRSAAHPKAEIPIELADGEILIPDFSAGSHQEDDRILLKGKFAESMADLEPLPIAPLRKYTQLYLVSAQSVSVLAEDIRRKLADEEAHGYLDDGTWPELISVDATPLCSALAVEGQCVVHACQSQGGVSGAPLFVFDDQGRMHLPAIHTRRRPRNKAQGPCDVEYWNAAPNSGLLVQAATSPEVKPDEPWITGTVKGK